MGNTPGITDEVEDIGKKTLVENHVEGNALLFNNDTKELRLIPVPSSDPNDLLNWTKWRKAGVIVVCCWFCMSTIFDVLDPYYAKEGKSTFVIIPLSLAFGRRPIFLCSALVMLASVIWAAFSQSYRSHLAARVFQGMASGASESLLPLMLSEISFLHQRASLLGAYWATQSLFTALLNIAASYEATVSWRWYYGVFSITTAVGIVGAFFFAPETRYQRKAMVVGNQFVFTNDFGETHIMNYKEAAATIQNLETAYATGQTQTFISKRTFIQELNPWYGKIYDASKLARQSYLRMLECYTSPGVWYASLAAAVSLGCAMGMGITISNVLHGSYHWPSSNLGLYNIGTIPAALAALVYSGWLADKFSIWLARRKGGLHTPEMRLIPMVLPLIVGALALVIYGVCTEWPDRYTWAGPVLGWNLFQFSFISILVISTTFTAEITPRDPGPALVVLSASKHWISFGLQYGMNPLADYAGYLWAMGILTIIFSGSLLLAIPVYFLNPKWRARVPSRSGLNGQAN
ncbi:hypothetical protein N7493_002639 [Penicillium malachiteum]|uniref:Major facilitator superfamily (MFS) profile domain-containing protein n=1 Tax=Penicillium malachiteum TaxID=1324776 RepID=A0AAD6HS74_9EURO|nr:hypothetical protein N7493_002639 [Penicillium malachiteum]